MRSWSEPGTSGSMARPFHFTTDTSSLFDEAQDGTDATWTIDTGNSIVSVTGGNADSWWIRQTDVSDEATIEARVQSAGGAPFGVIANYQSTTQYYLAYLRSAGQIRLYVKNGGYAVVASASYSTANGTYYRLKIATSNEAPNKRLIAYVDGVQQLSVATATVFSNGRGGLQANAAPGQVDFDWWILDLSMTLTFAFPSSGLAAGGTSFEVTGSDFGDGALPYIGSTVCTNISIAPTTSITCTSPAGAAGAADLTVKFGTAGTEEYTITATNGWTYVAAATTITGLIAQHRHPVFRRLQVKRRSGTGEYESDWQTVPANYIKSWGSIRSSTDNIIVGTYQQSGARFRFRNDDGYFNDENDTNSFWYSYYSRYRTLVRVQAGYYDEDLNEYPTSTTLFTGIINSDFAKTSKNEISIDVDSLDSVFKEVPMGDVLENASPTSTTYRADQLINLVKEHTDGSSNLIFQKFIASADWTVTTGTITYPGLNTSTAWQNETAWSLIQKLAQAENKVAYINPTGQFVFEARTDSATALAYELKGLGSPHTQYGHNIIEIQEQVEAVSRVYNRINVKFSETDAASSYHVREQAWSWGDGSSSDKYGVRTYNLDNRWIGTTAQATSIADGLFTQFSVLREEVKLTAKFLPHVFLGNVSLVSYQDQSFSETTLWGAFLWGAALWRGNSRSGGIQIDDERYHIMSVEHDLDNFKTVLHVRSEA